MEDAGLRLCEVAVRDYTKEIQQGIGGGSLSQYAAEDPENQQVCMIVSRMACSVQRKG
jgi:hypothetical protein